MDIIQRNFFRLLRSGAFTDNEPVEPMSAFKWRRLFQMVEAQGVIDIFLHGVSNHHGEKELNVPESVVEEAKKRLEELHDDGENAPKGVAMSFVLYNNRLQQLLTDERHSIDTSVETMDLLRILVSNEQDILNRGMSMKGLVRLGLYLRRKGDRVDFVKLQRWLQRIHLQRMAQLQGSFLIAMFGFEDDELPFVRHEEPQAYKLMVSSVGNLAKDTAQDWHFRQTRTGFVSGNTAILRRNLRRSIRYLPYATLETAASFVSNFAKSLKEIEE